jgi:hypothetical protein
MARRSLNSPHLKLFGQGSGRFNHRTGTDTPGTGIDPNCTAGVGNCSYLLQVWQPAAAIFVMCMADIVASQWSFSANITSTCHYIISLNKVLFLVELYKLTRYSRKNNFFLPFLLVSNKQAGDS